MKKTTCFALFCLIGLLLWSTPTFAQDDSCIAKAPAEVAVGQQFKYTVTLSEKGDVISSDFGKFEFISGPNIGSSTSITMMNGKVEQNTTYTYTYYLLGEKEGTFSIPGVVFSVDGRVVKSNYVEVKVVKTPKNMPQEEPGQADNWFQFQMPEFNWPFGEQRQPSQPKQGKVDIEDKIGKDDIFLKASTTQLDAYQGEAVVVTHKLYIKQELRGYNIERSNFAQTADFWMEPLELPYRAQQSTETVNGKTYHVFIVKQTAVYPTKTGKLTIPKLNLALRINVPAVVTDPFWGTITTTRGKDVHLSSNELVLKVKALPGAHSSEKTEVVGEFSITSTLGKEEGRVNEPLTLTISVSGTGNIHHISAEDLSMDFPGDFDVTKPRITTHVSAKGEIVSGTRTFKYTIVPRSEGTYIIPGATYTYYNYDMGTYKTITTQDFQIEILPERPRMPASDDLDRKSKTPAKTYKI